MKPNYTKEQLHNVAILCSNQREFNNISNAYNFSWNDGEFDETTPYIVIKETRGYICSKKILLEKSYKCINYSDVFNETPTQEQLILSIENRARKSANNLWIETDQREFTGHYMGFIAGWEEQEEQLLPIIKELGEALSRIANRTDEDDIFETDKYIAQTTLEKYKQYL